MAEENEQVIIITKGEKAEFDIFLEKASGFPRPIDLTNFDKFKLCLETESGVLEITEVANANGSSITKVSPDVLGQLKIVLGSADTINLREGFGQDMDIEWDNSVTPAPKRKRLHKSLNVEASLCQ
jgi:hypothetical protein